MSRKLDELWLFQEWYLQIVTPADVEHECGEQSLLLGRDLLQAQGPDTTGQLAIPTPESQYGWVQRGPYHLKALPRHRNSLETHLESSDCRD